MKKIILYCSVLLVVCGVWGVMTFSSGQPISGAPPYGEAESAVPELNLQAWLMTWKRPDGPPRVGLQVGHWKNEEIPEELHRLAGNTGSSGRGFAEWEVNYTIAEETKLLLETYGVIVDLLPTTVPPSYLADAFIAIHADGNTDARVSGYKVAPPWRDWSGKSSLLSQYIFDSYGTATELSVDPTITRNMRGYYAFSFWRFKHAIHPMTPAVILETGFLTNPHDQAILIDRPKQAAEGIAQGIKQFLVAEQLLSE